MRKNSLLPDFRNFGVHLRVLLIVNLLAIITALILSPHLRDIWHTFIELSAIVQPVLIVSLICLYLFNPALQRVAYFAAVAIILLWEIIIVSAGFAFYQPYLLSASANLARTIVLTIICTAIVLYYFALQKRAYSPAISEARLQALQARIRPHFLFNAINAVLSLMRSQPKQAETALEDMADLFRVLMADNRELVPLAQEIALSRQYLAIEKLRLGERLNVNWQMDSMPPDAMIPPLILQPLIENAVYHGIEPLTADGDINIHISNRKKDIVIKIDNPYVSDKQHNTGNKMAQNNIKERLLLHFDLEASLQYAIENDRYIVTLLIPTLR